MCVNTSSSMAPLSASVSWNAQRASRMTPGSGGELISPMVLDPGRGLRAERLTHRGRCFLDCVAPCVHDPGQAHERMDHAVVALEHHWHPGASQLLGICLALIAQRIAFTGDDHR